MDTAQGQQAQPTTITPDTDTREKARSQARLALALVVILPLVVGAILFMLADDVAAGDWRNYYLPALRDWSHRFDYEVYNPPWTVIPLHILYYGFGDHGGYALLGLLNTAAITWSAYILSPDRRPIRVLLACLNIPMVYLVFLGQVDGLANFGLTLAIISAPTRWERGSPGFIIAMIKPQMTLGAALIAFWRYTTKRHLLLVGLAFLLVSMALWGAWPTQLDGVALTQKDWNRAFPYQPLGWVLGAAMLGYGVWKKEEAWGALAMPFLMPYFGPHSFALIVAYGVARLPLNLCWLGWLLPNLYVIATL